MTKKYLPLIIALFTIVSLSAETITPIYWAYNKSMALQGESPLTTGCVSAHGWILNEWTCYNDDQNVCDNGSKSLLITPKFNLPSKAEFYFGSSTDFYGSIYISEKRDSYSDCILNNGTMIKNSKQELSAEIQSKYEGKMVYIIFSPRIKSSKWMSINMLKVTGETPILSTTPTIISSANSLTFKNLFLNRIGTEVLSLDIGGANLTEDITVSLSNNSCFQISLAETSNFSNSLTINTDDGKAEAKLYVKFIGGNEAKTVSETITINSTQVNNSISLNSNILPESAKQEIIVYDNNGQEISLINLGNISEDNLYNFKQEIQIGFKNNQSGNIKANIEGNTFSLLNRDKKISESTNLELTITNSAIIIEITPKVYTPNNYSSKLTLTSDIADTLTLDIQLNIIKSDNPEKKNTVIFIPGLNMPRFGFKPWREENPFLNTRDKFWYLDFDKSYGWYDVKKSQREEDDRDDFMCGIGCAANMMHTWMDFNDDYLQKINYTGPRDYTRDIDPTYYPGSDVWGDFINNYPPNEYGKYSDWARNACGWFTHRYFSDYFTSDDIEQMKGAYILNKTSPDREGLTQAIKTCLDNGWLMSLLARIYSVPAIGTNQTGTHAITLYGAEFDENNLVVALFVTNTDDQAPLMRITVGELNDGTYTTTRCSMNTGDPNRYGNQIISLDWYKIGRNVWERHFPGATVDDENHVTQTVEIYAIKNQVYITGTQSPISIYNLSGECIISDSYKRTITIEENGFYLVRCEEKTYKIAITH